MTTKNAIKAFTNREDYKASKEKNIFEFGGDYRVRCEKLTKGNFYPTNVELLSIQNPSA